VVKAQKEFYLILLAHLWALLTVLPLLCGTWLFPCSAMRRFESYCVYLSLYALWYKSALPFTSAVPVSLPVALATHLFLEQPRWQLAPLYALDTYLLYSILLTSDANWPAGWIFILFGTAVTMAAAALACLLPVAKFPELTGQYTMAKWDRIHTEGKGWKEDGYWRRGQWQSAGQ